MLILRKLAAFFPAGFDFGLEVRRVWTNPIDQATYEDREKHRESKSFKENLNTFLKSWKVDNAVELRQGALCSLNDDDWFDFGHATAHSVAVTKIAIQSPELAEGIDILVI